MIIHLNRLAVRSLIIVAVLSFACAGASGQQLKNLRKSKPAESYECQRAKAALQAMLRKPGYHYGMDAQGISNMDCWYAISMADLYTDFKTDAQLKREAEQAQRDREQAADDARRAREDAEDDARRAREDAEDDARRAREEAADDAARDAKRQARRRSWSVPSFSPGFGTPTRSFTDEQTSVDQQVSPYLDASSTIDQQTNDLELSFLSDPNMLLNKEAVERRIAQLEAQIANNTEGADAMAMNGFYESETALYSQNWALRRQIDMLQRLQRSSDQREQNAMGSNPFSVDDGPTRGLNNAGLNSFPSNGTPGFEEFDRTFLPPPPPAPDPEIARRAEAQARASRVGDLLDQNFGDLGGAPTNSGWRDDLASLDAFTNTFTSPNPSKPLVSIADMTTKAPPPARMDPSRLDEAVKQFNARAAAWPPRDDVAIDELADYLGEARPYGSSGPSAAEYGGQLLNAGGEIYTLIHNATAVGNFEPRSWNPKTYQFERDGGPGLLGTSELVADQIGRELPAPVRGVSKLQTLSDLSDVASSVVDRATSESRVEQSQQLTKLLQLRDRFVQEVESSATPGIDPWHWSSPYYSTRSELNKHIRILESVLK